MLGGDRRFQNHKLNFDTRQPFTISRSYALTPMIFLHEHVQTSNAGTVCSLMQTRQPFWIIFENGTVKHYLSDCAKSLLRKVKLVRQLALK